MVDCFFLITEFFVLTFKFKIDEAVLPQRLPPGIIPGPIQTRNMDQSLIVKVNSTHGESGVATYTVQGTPLMLAGLTDTLSNAARNSGTEKYSVQVSYDANAPWSDVLAVFNACNKVKIATCGLVPLRGTRGE
jgi:biopolymer transport protein ExbD